MYAHSRRPSRTPSKVYWRGALLLAFASLASPTCVLPAGAVYRSVDAEGHVVYSDQADTSIAQQTSVGIEDSQPGADTDVSASEAPPPLPDNEQPPCPEDGYLWTPGYWAWSAAGYYWVPGVWTQPPRVGVLWTPGYWRFVGAVYIFHRGYWGPHIGYYGGINYGFGYYGVGFAGGRWAGNSFAYNKTVSNVDAHIIHNTYSETVYNDGSPHRLSYNGGPGGTTSAPTAQERAFAAEAHIPPTPLQRQTMLQAARTPALMPHGSPTVNQARSSTDHRTVAAIPKPVVFNAPATVEMHSTAAPPSASPREPAHVQPNNRVSSQAAVAHPSAPKPTHATPTRLPPPTHSTH